MTRIGKRDLEKFFERLRARLAKNPELQARPYRVWHQAAQDCGVENLVDERNPFGELSRLEGVCVPFTVSIMLSRFPGSTSAVVAVRGAPAVVRVYRESLLTRASKVASARDLVLGHPAFDDGFFVAGDPVAVRATFDADTRALAFRLFEHATAPRMDSDDGVDVGIENGAVVVRYLDDDGPHAITPREVLGGALVLAERMAEERQEERLADVGRGDPSPEVRRGALELLRDARPGHAATVAALHAACADPNLEIRLLAAAALGLKGHATLLELASRTDGPDQVSARAVGELRSHLPPERAIEILDAALVARRHLTAAACLDTLGRSGPHADVAARVLADLPDPGVGVAAAHALERCGTPAEVELLYAVADKHARHKALSAAARDAIAAIQSRQAGAAAGQLSITVVEGVGRVSVAEEGGQVSLADEGATAPDADE